MVQLKPIQEQVVVVFGASSGIGRATALQLAQRGAKLVIAARGSEDLMSLFDEITVSGGAAIAIPADVTDYAAVQMVADRAVEAYGRLDTWVHVAALTMFSPFSEMTPEEFKQIIDVNLTGQVYGMMAALPYLRREGRGALIHISSVLSKISVPYQSAYCASKHGLEGVLESLRMELKHEGMPISVTSIQPSSINTPLYEQARTKLGVLPMPVPPIYDAEDVARAVVCAAEAPMREIVVGSSGAALVLGQRLAPQVLDALIRRFGFALQRTDEPKSPEAATNLFNPLSGYDRVDGAFDRITQPANLFARPAVDPLAEAVANVAANVAESAAAVAASAATMVTGLFGGPRRRIRPMDEPLAQAAANLNASLVD